MNINMNMNELVVIASMAPMIIIIGLLICAFIRSEMKYRSREYLKGEGKPIADYMTVLRRTRLASFIVVGIAGVLLGISGITLVILQMTGG